MNAVRSLVVLFALAGCAHATRTRSEEKGASAGDKTDKNKDKADKSEKTAQTPRREETITTSKTTNEMFKEEGIKKLQHSLAEKSKGVEETGKLDTKTQEALRAFQKDQKLPDTGLPDYETIRRLGVKPEDIFQHAPPSQRVGVQ